jgi:hypothetical protein
LSGVQRILRIIISFYHFCFGIQSMHKSANIGVSTISDAQTSIYLLQPSHSLGLLDQDDSKNPRHHGEMDISFSVILLVALLVGESCWAIVT